MADHQHLLLPSSTSAAIPSTATAATTTTSSKTKRRRRGRRRPLFAPLNLVKAAASPAPAAAASAAAVLEGAQQGQRQDVPKMPGVKALGGVVFDVDGTLCEPQNYMFAQMRSALSIPRTTDILTHIYTFPPSAQEPAMTTIRAIESEAMKSQKPQPGLQQLMSYLEERNIRRGICTRNFDAPVAHLLTTFLPGVEFSPIVTRAFRPPKPDPAGILHIAGQWGVKGEDLIMVGDSIDDMTAGHLAGAYTILLANAENKSLVEHEHTDFWVDRLDEIIPLLEYGFREEEEEGKGVGDGVGEG